MCDIINRNRKEASLESKHATRINDLKNLMSTMHLSAKQAMDALRIPENEQDFYFNSL